MPYSVKGFFEINEDMVQIQLVLEVLFTQNSEVEDLFCGAFSGSEWSRILKIAKPLNQLFLQNGLTYLAEILYVALLGLWYLVLSK